MSATAPPYMMSMKNIPAILDKIKGAGTPPKFTYEFLKASLGFASSADRNIVSVLKRMRFLTEDGTPTDRYNQFRGSNSSAVLAEAIQEGWPEIFLADQKAYEKTVEQLKETFKSVTGKADSVAYKMAATFKAFCSQADFSAQAPSPVTDEAIDINDSQDESKQQFTNNFAPPVGGSTLNLKHDIHIHLPSTSDVAVYKAIFRALKDELSD